MGGERGRRDREAFERFCADEYTRLVSAVLLVVGDREVAVDAVNEALARAWNRVRQGDAIDTLGAWIRVVAFNVAYDHHRRRKLETKHLSDMLAVDAHDVEYATWGASLDLRAAVHALPPRQREVVVLHYFFDLPVTEIARDLNISVSTVKSSIQLARASLHAVLRDASEEVLHDAS